MTDLINSPPKPNPTATRVPVTCGDCVFHTNMRLPNAARPCGSMGCATSRAPCLQFAPNVFHEGVSAAMDAKAIREALNAIPDAALGALAVALPELRRLRAVGFRMGQLVYFNAAGNSGGRDYVANYYRARVMMLDKDGNVMIGGKGVTAIISVDSVLSEKAWKAKRKQLVAKGAIFDPKSPFTWERRDEALLIDPKYRPDWLDKKIAEYRASYLEAKATRQTHDYDAAPVKRGRGRPRKDGRPAQARAKTTQAVRTRDLSATT